MTPPYAVIAAMTLLAPLQSGANEPRPVSRIFFGSCLKEQEPAPILAKMLEHQPELLLFLGDNIYADTSDMAVMKTKYGLLGSIPDFQKLRGVCPVHATWDDHDYGLNDSGADFPMREQAQQVFLDFWGDPTDSPRRKRPGVYEAAIYGEPKQRVQVIMLDTRYFRGPLKKGEKRLGGSWYPGEDSTVTMLGEAQWDWLEDELQKPAEIRLLVSSIQLVATAAGQETWANLPHEQKRLYDLIARTKANGVIVLSGDRHWAELSVQREGVAYPIWDLTSSSFNQLHERGTPTENDNRALAKTWHRENFGEIAIDWRGEETVVQLQIRDLEGAVVLEQAVVVNDLRAK